MLYPEEQLYKEMTFISYYLHWSRDEIMGLNHRERRRWCLEVSAINERLNKPKEKEIEFR